MTYNAIKVNKKKIQLTVVHWSYVQLTKLIFPYSKWSETNEFL